MGQQGSAQKSLLRKKANQVLLVGLPDVGKTLFLYTVKVKSLNNPADVVRQTKTASKSAQEAGMEQATNEVVSFHYEEISHGNQKYGVWDVAGNEAMRELWLFYYRHIKFDAVLFLVKGQETSYEKLCAHIEESRHHLRVLMQEEELRNAAFVIIINKREPSSTEAAGMKNRLPGGSAESRKENKNAAAAASADMTGGEGSKQQHQQQQLQLHHPEKSLDSEDVIRRLRVDADSLEDDALNPKRVMVLEMDVALGWDARGKAWTDEDLGSHGGPQEGPALPKLISFIDGVVDINKSGQLE